MRAFALKLQQFTGPLMAKAMEDTAFYRYHRLLAFNEVGGDPTADELPLPAFHNLQQQRVETGACGLTATATHDTKRGEDARGRILALSELAEDWDAGVKDWHSRNAALVRHTDGKRLPTKAHEYMLYQALVGAWPGKVDGVFVKRMQDYALKAAREGKEQTSWTDPDAAYEAALRDFVAGLLDAKISTGFLASFGNFAARAALLGALNSLSQLALKVTLPGVPDFYQGTELLDLSLVDPDNRRKVDYAARRDLLCLERLSWSALTVGWHSGAVKLILARELWPSSPLARPFPCWNLRTAGGDRLACEPCHCLCAYLEKKPPGGDCWPPFRAAHRWRATLAVGLGWSATAASRQVPRTPRPAHARS